MADALEATPVFNSGGGHYNHAFFWDVCLGWSIQVLSIYFLSFCCCLCFDYVFFINPTPWHKTFCIYNPFIPSFQQYISTHISIFNYRKWPLTTRQVKPNPPPALEAMINKSSGSLDEIKFKFKAQAAPGAVFRSGWVWVAVNIVMNLKSSIHLIKTIH